MIPVSLTWTAVEAAVSDFLANDLVVGGLLLAIALVFIPRVTRTILGVFGRRR